MKARDGRDVLGCSSDNVAVIVLPADVGLHVALARTQEQIAKQQIVERRTRPGGASESDG